MKLIKCPKCGQKYNVVSQGNTDGQYQMIFTCFCQNSEKRRATFSITGRSKAQVIYRLRIWRDRYGERLVGNV